VLYVLSFALMDTVNFLLIGVLVAVGVAQPLKDKGGRYGSVATLLVFGDWLGVLLLALLTMLVFDGLGEKIATLVESPVFGVLLILTGVVSAVLAWRGDGDGSSGLVERIMKPLRTPSPATVGTGVVLGLVQSATSVPFFAGIAVMSAGDFDTVTRYAGMFAYASVALSLPFLCALVVGYIRMRPYSAVGRRFAWMRQNQGTVARAGGYIVAVLLILLGAVHLL
jgi:cytochrome c biogenesis protein CcdA